MPLVQHTKIEHRARLVRISLLPLVIVQPTMTTSREHGCRKSTFRQVGAGGEGAPSARISRTAPQSSRTTVYGSAHRTVTAVTAAQQATPAAKG